MIRTPTPRNGRATSPTDSLRNPLRSGFVRRTHPKATMKGSSIPRLPIDQISEIALRAFAVCPRETSARPRGTTNAWARGQQRCRAIPSPRTTSRCRNCYSCLSICRRGKPMSSDARNFMLGLFAGAVCLAGSLNSSAMAQGVHRPISRQIPVWAGTRITVCSFHRRAVPDRWCRIRVSHTFRMTTSV